jgi:hypothetical protein
LIVVILKDVPGSLEGFGVVHEGEKQLAVHGAGGRRN